MIYYIADMHFGHTNVLRFDNRPFSDTAQMDDTLIQNWNERVADDDTIYILGDAFWKNEENSIQIMERLRGHKHLIQGNHDRVKGKLRPYWESIEQYAEVNDENRLVILSHYPILFYKNQHYGAVMLYGHVHNTREWKLVEKWKNEQWAMGIPSRLINVGCMMDYMRYTPRTLTGLLDANPMPEIARDRKDGSAVESAEQQNKRGRTWVNELRFSNNFVEKRSSSFLKALRNQDFLSRTLLCIGLKSLKLQNEYFYDSA